MLMVWEVAELLRQKTGQRLRQTQYTQAILVDEMSGRHYWTALYGPYFPVEERAGRMVANHDTRLWISYRRLESSVSMQVLCQDADDDVFLNCNAVGIEQYPKEVVIS